MNDSSISNAAASTQVPVVPIAIDMEVCPAMDELAAPAAPATGPGSIGASTGKNIKDAIKSPRTMASLELLERVNWTLVILVIFGLLLIWASFMAGISADLAIALALAGISITAAAILYFSVSPSRVVDTEVCDAMSLSNAELVNTVLEPLVGDARGVYIPSSIVGATQVMLLAKDSEFSRAFLDNSASITGVSAGNKSSIFLTPPGYGLFAYVKSLGASFTREGLEDQIKDVLVNGLELAPSVEVSYGESIVRVKVSGLSGSHMCKAMRKAGKSACRQLGCPICSFIACMVAEGTGARAMIDDVKFDNGAVDLYFKLL